MQVVFLLSLRKRFGGGDYSLFKFSEALAERGNKVAVFYLGNSSIYPQKSITTFEIFRKYNLEIDIKGRGLVNLIIDWICDQIFLIRYLKKNKDKIDFIVGYQREMALKAVILGSKFGIKTVNFTFETPEWLIKSWPAWKKFYSNDKNLRISWELYKRALISSDLIIANSNLTADETNNWIGRKPDLILYPGFTPVDTVCENDRNEDQIIYVGRLEENKNVNEIIEALALVNTEIKLVICGSGSLEEKLLRLSKLRNVTVEFKGKVTDQQKWDEISKSLFMVFPSSFEGFGMPPMEALAMGRPCLCSNLSILKEIYGDNVEYFEEHNIIELSEKIKNLLSNRNYLNEIGTKGREFVFSKFGWTKSANLLERKLLETLSKLPSR